MASHLYSFGLSPLFANLPPDKLPLLRVEGDADLVKLPRIRREGQGVLLTGDLGEGFFRRNIPLEFKEINKPPGFHSAVHASFEGVHLALDILPEQRENKIHADEQQRKVVMSVIYEFLIIP